MFKNSDVRTAWPVLSGLTLRSSGLAYGKPLTLGVRQHEVTAPVLLRAACCRERLGSGRFCQRSVFCRRAVDPVGPRPAYGGRLIWAVSPITRSMRAATRSSAPPCSKGFQAFWASSACAASATSYPSCSAAPLPWPSGFSWAAHVFKAGRSLLAFGSNSALKLQRW